MANKENNVVLNFKMDGQIEYAKTLRDINAIMNAAASEYRTHVMAMGKDADQTKKLAAEKKKLEIQLEAGQERTKRLRAEYEAMAKDTKTTTGQLANKHRQLQNSERAEIALSNALERVNEGLSEQAIESRKAEEALNKLESESEDLERQTEKLNAEYELQKAQLGENASETDKLNLQMEHLNKTHELAEEKVKNYEEQLEQAKLQYGESSAEVDQYEVQLLEARTAEQQLANEIDATNQQLKEQAGVLDKVGESLEKAGKKMTDTGKTLSKRVTAPVMGAAAAAAKIGSDFEAGMSQVQAISGATGDDLEELTLKAREVGAETMFSASEAAEALNYMALAGWDTQQMLDGIDGVMSLAAASGEDLAKTSDIVTDSLSAFKMEVSESSRLADVLAAASANANTDVSGLGAAFQYVAPVAGALGFSIEDTAHAIGLMSDNGIKGQKAGTALRTMMTNLAKPTAAMEDAMEELGLSLTDSEGNMKDFDTVMKELQVSFADLSEAEQASAAATIFGKEAMSGALAIIGTSTEDYNKLGDAIKNSSGSAEEMAEVMQDNLQGRLKEAQSAMEEAAITVYDNLQPALESIVSGIKQAADWFNELSPTMQTTIVIIAGLAAAIGPLLVVAGMVVSSIGALIPVFAALMGPIGLVIAGIAALIAVGVALWKNWDTVKKKAIEFKDTVVGKFTEIKDGIVKRFTELKDGVGNKISELISNAVNKFNELKDGLISKTIEIKDSIVGFFTETIPQAFNDFIAFIQEVPERVMEFLSKLFLEDIPYAIGYGIGWMVKTVSEGFNNTVEFFKELPGRILEFLLETIENLTTWATDTKDKAIETGTDFLNSVVEYFKKLPGRIWGFLTDTYNKISDWTSNTKDKAVEAGSNFLNSLIDYVKKLPGRIATFLSDTISKMTEFAGNMKDKAVETGKNVFNSIVDEVKRIPGRLMSLGSDIITGLVDGVKKSIGKVVNIAKDIASSFVGGFKKAMGIKSPSTIMRALGQFVSEGLGLGIEDEADFAINKTENVARSITGTMQDGIDLPDMEIGTVVRQPSNFGRQQTSGSMDVSALNNIGSNIRDSLKGLSGNINVNVFLDSDQLNSQLAPGMSQKLNNMNKLNARSQGVIIL